MNATAPHGASKRTGSDAGPPPPLEAVRPLQWGPKGPIVLIEGRMLQDLLRRIETRRGKKGLGHAAEEIAYIKHADAEYHAATSDDERQQATDFAMWSYRNLVRLDSDPPTDEEVARGRELLKPFTDALRALAESAPAKTVPPPVRTITARPRTTRRQHVSTRTTATATAGADSSPHSAAGSPRRGTSARAEDDLAPAGKRIRLTAHQWGPRSLGSAVIAVHLFRGGAS
jgi:hypothetical protein